MAYHNNQQHLNPPRLCFQNRSLSARESGAVDGQFDAPGDDPFLQGTATATPQRQRQLSASTDQLLIDSFRHNVSLAHLPRSNHHHQHHQHRILPCPPLSPIAGAASDQQQRQQGEAMNRYRKRSGGQRKKASDTTEARRKEFREKATTGNVAIGQQWHSTGCDASAHCQQSANPTNSGGTSFGGLKNRLAFSLFGLGKSADTERADKSPTASDKKNQQQKQQQQQQQQHQEQQQRRSSSASCQLIGAGSNGTATTAKRKADTMAHANGTQATVATPKRISNAAQQLIISCLDKSRGDLSGRVLSRAIHKRADFNTFCANLSAAEQWPTFAEQFHKYVVDVLGSLQNVEQISLMSKHFGADQVNRRIYGFKADFFATIANSLATECVFLDGASHSPTDAIEAWAELVEMMFSSVRDGYYAEVRRRRRCSGNVGGDSKCGQTTKMEKL